MRRALLSFLLFLSMLALAARFGAKPLAQVLGYQTRAGLKVVSEPQATVFINGKEVGQTPFEDDNLQVREYQVSLVKNEMVWQGTVKLNKGTLSVANRELGETAAFSSGEVLTLESGKGITVTSLPEGVKVEIDGKDYGQTPVSLTDLAVGDHNLLLSKDGYLQRSIRATLPAGLQLHLDVDLAISESLAEDTPAPVTPVIPKVTVLQTPIGFLRLRDRPSLQGKEIAQATVGSSLTLLEELSGWDKVRLDNGLEGYVSSSYVRKQ
ncbi:MAG: PEGA domain-containing protein [bacterium]|nr:PEGA domain-containing protein [bacterium]